MDLLRSRNWLWWFAAAVAGTISVVMLYLSLGLVACDDVQFFDPGADGEEARLKAQSWLDRQHSSYQCRLVATELEDRATGPVAIAYFKAPAPAAGPIFFLVGASVGFIAILLVIHASSGSGPRSP